LCHDVKFVGRLEGQLRSDVAEMYSKLHVLSWLLPISANVGKVVRRYDNV